MNLILFLATGVFALGAAARSCPVQHSQEPKGHEWHKPHPKDPNFSQYLPYPSRSSLTSPNYLITYLPCPPGRSPCPGLNVLANHGFLPRSGRDISLPTLRDAVSAAYNYEPTAFDQPFRDAIAFNLSTTRTPDSTFHLADLALHDAVEFDGSLSRSDFHLGDNLNFDPKVWGGVARNLGLDDESKREFVSVEVAAKARAARVKEAMRLNDRFNASAAQMAGSPGTTALWLVTLWDDEKGAAPKRWVKAFFGEFVPGTWSVMEMDQC